MWAITEEYDLAIVDYDRAVELGMDHASVYNNRGISRVDKKQYDLAIADFEKAIEKDPLEFMAYSNKEIASRLKATSAQPKPKNYLSVDLNAADGEAYEIRGISFLDIGEFRPAIEDFTHAIKLKPNNAEAYCFRGFAFSCEGEYYRAIMDYDKAIVLEPTYGEPYYNKAMAYRRKGKHINALECFDVDQASIANAEQRDSLVRPWSFPPLARE